MELLSRRIKMLWLTILKYLFAMSFFIFNPRVVFPLFFGNTVLTIIVYFIKPSSFFMLFIAFIEMVLLSSLIMFALRRIVYRSLTQFVQVHRFTLPGKMKNIQMRPDINPFRLQKYRKQLNLIVLELVEKGIPKLKPGKYKIITHDAILKELQRNIPGDQFFVVGKTKRPIYERVMSLSCKQIWNKGYYRLFLSKPEYQYEIILTVPTDAKKHS